jgi:hypothetical protein
MDVAEIDRVRGPQLDCPVEALNQSRYCKTYTMKVI